MTSNRLDTVVSAMVEGIRQAVIEQDVTFEEYRQGIGYMIKVAESGELPLLIDVFMNATIVENVNRKSTQGSSPSDMEGPYFIEDVPEVSGKLRVLDDDRSEPLLLRGRVTDLDDRPLAGATLFVWSSTHDGKYGGIHDDLPRDLYRGRLRTDADGRYEVETRVPVPYQIPNSGPVGQLLDAMGRHSWRPAHVHYKIRHDDFRELTTQVYFEGGEYVDDDCCEGIVPAEFVKPVTRENGKVVLDVDFRIEPSTAAVA